MKLTHWKTLLTLVLCICLATPAEAQRGGRNGGRGGRGGGRGGGNRNGGEKANKKAAAASKKAQKEAAEKAKALQKQKTAELKQWTAREKQRATARQAMLKSQQTLPTEMGPIFRSKCSSCHVPPDPKFPADSAWIEALATTHCREIPPDLRTGLAAYLRENDDFRPQTVASYAEPAPGLASIVSTIEGELFLSGPGGANLRLFWGPGQAGEKRVVAPGKYRVTGYRATRGSWSVSVSGGLRQVTISPDQNLPLSLGSWLELNLSAAPSIGQGSLNSSSVRFELVDSEGQAASLYYNGQRLRIPFQVVNHNGVASAHGVMAYGSEGRASAQVEVPLGGPSWVRVDLPRDMPFKIEGVSKAPLPLPR